MSAFGALIGFFVLMVRASCAKELASMFRWVTFAGLAIAGMFAAFYPLWQVWKRFNTNFGSSLDGAMKIPPILYLYVLWTLVFVIRLALKRPLSQD